MEYRSIDISLALEQLGGSDKLYKTVVKGFHERYTEVHLTIEKHLRRGEMEDARRMAHSMKGLSGNLGAVKLREKALNLEIAIKEDAPNVRAVLMAFSEELAKVNLEVCDILENKYGVRQPCPELMNGRTSPIQHYCMTLVKALEAYRFSEINNTVLELKRANIPMDKKATFDRVFGLIENFEYDEALILLKEV